MAGTRTHAHAHAHTRTHTHTHRHPDIRMSSHQLETSCKQNTDTQCRWRYTEFPPAPAKLCISVLYAACFRLKSRPRQQCLSRYSSVPSHQWRDRDLEFGHDHFHSTPFPCHIIIQYFYSKLQIAALNTTYMNCKWIAKILPTN